VTPYALFFVPYYTAAVAALVVHVVCAFHYLGYAGIAAGAVLAVAIVAAFGGAFYPVTIPSEYRATFGASL
jgi:hypothetical protein